MTTDELIRALRKCASPANRSLDAPQDECKGCPFEKPESWMTHMSECIDALQNAAADRLEELDERVAIMMEGNKIESE